MSYFPSVNCHITTVAIEISVFPAGVLGVDGGHFVGDLRNGVCRED